MYPDKFAAQHPERAAFVMADSGQSVSYAEFEMREQAGRQLAARLAGRPASRLLRLVP